MGEERKEVRSNSMKKVRGDRVRRTGRWVVGGNKGQYLIGRKLVGDEEVDVGQVVSAGGWGNEECMSAIFFTM